MGKFAGPPPHDSSSLSFCAGNENIEEREQPIDAMAIAWCFCATHDLVWVMGQKLRSRRGQAQQSMFNKG